MIYVNMREREREVEKAGKGIFVVGMSMGINYDDELESRNYLGTREITDQTCYGTDIA